MQDEKARTPVSNNLDQKVWSYTPKDKSESVAEESKNESPVNLEDITTDNTSNLYNINEIRRIIQKTQKTDNNNSYYHTFETQIKDKIMEEICGFMNQPKESKLNQSGLDFIVKYTSNILSQFNRAIDNNEKHDFLKGKIKKENLILNSYINAYKKVASHKNLKETFDSMIINSNSFIKSVFDETGKFALSLTYYPASIVASYLNSESQIKLQKFYQEKTGYKTYSFPGHIAANVIEASSISYLLLSNSEIPSTGCALMGVTYLACKTLLDMFITDMNKFENNQKLLEHPLRVAYESTKKYLSNKINKRISNKQEKTIKSFYESNKK